MTDEEIAQEQRIRRLLSSLRASYRRADMYLIWSNGKILPKPVPPTFPRQTKRSF